MKAIDRLLEITVHTTTDRQKALYSRWTYADLKDGVYRLRVLGIINTVIRPLGLMIVLDKP